MRIIDTHAHAYDVEYPFAPNRKTRPDTRNRMLDGRSALDYWTNSGLTVERQLAEMDEAGIIKTCIVIGTSLSRAAREAGSNLIEHVSEHYLRAHADRFIGFADCDPVRGNGAFNIGCLRSFRHAIEDLGFTGMKLVPTDLQLSPADARMYPVYELASTLDVPIMLYWGLPPMRHPTIEMARPILLDKILSDFPSLRLLVQCVGEPWEFEFLALMAKYENLYTDVSDLRRLGLARVAQDIGMAREMGVLKRVCFGTDTTCRPPKLYVDWILAAVGTTLPKLGHEALQPDEVSGLMRTNAERFLRLPSASEERVA